MKTFYTASATVTSGHERRIVADEPRLDLELSTPKPLGGQGGEGTNPEQIFAAGYAACFSSAVAYVAKGQGVETGNFEMTGRASLGKLDSGGFGFAMELTGSFPSLEHDQAETLMRAAHEVCPYANATRGNVPVEFKVA